jgi:osmotically-inducible protein OsmY
MDKIRPRILAFCGTFLVLASLGCDGQDTDRIARVARCVGDKIEAATQDGNGHWDSWPVLKSPAGNSLQSRVAARLRWDKSLEGSDIQIQVNEKTVELQGTVENLLQRRRAVDLAESTVGVAKVDDRLEVSNREP